MRLPRTSARFLRGVAAYSGIAVLLLLPAYAPAQAPAPTPGETAPASASEASEEDASEGAAPGEAAEPGSAEPEAVEPDAAGPATSEPATSEPDAAPVPDPSAEYPAPESAAAESPAAAAAESPASEAEESPDPLAEDDYEGATDAALVSEEPGPKNLSLGVALDVTVPLGSTSKFIGSASMQGISLDLRYYAWGNIGIGAGVALDSLSKKSTGAVTWENATITGTHVRELSYTPITLKGYYAWRDHKSVVPYFAAGLGAARAVKRLTAGISSISEASWHFAIVPEAGLQIPLGPTVLLTNVRLNYLPPSAGVDEQLFGNFSLGLSIQ